MRSVLLLVFFVLMTPVAANTLYPLKNAEQEARFHNLLKQYRCLVCQNQDLADSNASLAKDLRLQVYTLVKEGKTEAQINYYLTSRYGDFILFKPPLKTATWLLWFGPFIFLIVGFLFWMRKLA